MADLDTLRPEVREAWQRIVADEQRPEDFECVQAELLRLSGSLTARQTIDAISRAEAAEAELAEAQNTIAAQQDTMGALKRKLALAVGELAALKARIEGGIDMGYPVECSVGSRRGRIINPFTPPKWIGKHVRLVVEE